MHVGQGFLADPEDGGGRLGRRLALQVVPERMPRYCQTLTTWPRASVQLAVAVPPVGTDTRVWSPAYTVVVREISAPSTCNASAAMRSAPSYVLTVWLGTAMSPVGTNSDVLGAAELKYTGRVFCSSPRAS